MLYLSNTWIVTVCVTDNQNEITRLAEISCIILENQGLGKLNADGKNRR